MDRAKKFKVNAIVSIVKQLTTVIFGLILPKYILSYYGSEINGLVSSITQFLGFIALLEMGIGPVIQSNLYKPLAKKDNEEISRIFVSASRFFRTIGRIFIVYVIVLLFIYPKVINSQFDYVFTVSLIIIISISTLAEYYFGITYSILLNADQLAYVQMSVQIAFMVINTVCSVILIKVGCSIQIVKLCASIIYVIRPLVLSWYVSKHYNINKSITYTEEPIKQKWNGFTQHLASVINQKTDVMVLTVLSTLENVSIYSVYHQVVNGIVHVVINSAIGMDAMWGNMIANDEKEELLKSFSKMETFTHFLVTVIFSITAILITPFVRVYTMGISDAEYCVPVFGYILTFAYAAQGLRIPYFRMIKAAGHYKQTQLAALVQAILNIVTSIALVYHFGLIGVAVGTLIAMMYHTVYFVFYLRKNIIFRRFRYFLKHFVVDLICIALLLFINLFVNIECINYFEWVLSAIVVSIEVIFVTSVINAIAYREEMYSVFKILKLKLNKKMM